MTDLNFVCIFMLVLIFSWVVCFPRELGETLTFSYARNGWLEDWVMAVVTWLYILTAVYFTATQEVSMELAQQIGMLIGFGGFGYFGIQAPFLSNPNVNSCGNIPEFTAISAMLVAQYFLF